MARKSTKLFVNGEQKKKFCGKKGDLLVLLFDPQDCSTRFEKFLPRAFPTKVVMTSESKQLFKQSCITGVFGSMFVRYSPRKSLPNLTKLQRWTNSQSLHNKFTGTSLKRPEGERMQFLSSSIKLLKLMTSLLWITYYFQFCSPGQA